MTVIIDTESPPGSWAKALDLSPERCALADDIDRCLAERKAARAANSARSFKAARTRAGKTSPERDGSETGGMPSLGNDDRPSHGHWPRECGGVTPAWRSAGQPPQPHGSNPVPSHPHK